MSAKPPPGLGEEHIPQYRHIAGYLRRERRKVNRRVPGSKGHQEAVAHAARWERRLQAFLAKNLKTPEAQADEPGSKP